MGCRVGGGGVGPKDGAAPKPGEIPLLRTPSGTPSPSISSHSPFAIVVCKLQGCQHKQRCHGPCVAGEAKVADDTPGRIGREGPEPLRCPAFSFGDHKQGAKIILRWSHAFFCGIYRTEDMG